MEEKILLDRAGVERLWANICTLVEDSVGTLEEQKVSMTVVDSLPAENIIPNMIYLVPAGETPPGFPEIDEEVAGQ